MSGAQEVLSEFMNSFLNSAKINLDIADKTWLPLSGG